ncbi:hypothetical protein BGZ70_009927 [Mortierella alpina]|uniref:VOC domain-containing protein n=1 Tax=Mortierella alpina TaxID=64518 RepID=A0A9P6LZ78_MORAP|nr:hypothetical protein BGZ70_009927 [Mortierella alpina]
MPASLALITLVVEDYDKAIEFYTEKLHFRLVEDTPLTPQKRWVVVSPPGNNQNNSNNSGCNVLLAKAANDEQSSRVGNQTGGRVFLFLHTDNFQRDYQNLLTNNVRIVRAPSVEPYGTVAVFSDLYGNLWDLIGPNPPGAHSLGNIQQT